MKGFRYILPAVLLALFCWLSSGSGVFLTAYSQNTVTGTVTMKRNDVLSQRAQVILSRLMSANQISTDSVQGIAVVESNEYNAATDGKSIIFTDTLWNAFTTDDQRAFVIGHELSHIKLGHIKQTAYRRIALGALDKLVFERVSKGNQRFQQVENIGLSLLDMKFSRRMEYAADDKGVQIMVNAKYNPKAAMEAFEILNKHDTSGSPEFLRSHPLSGSRIRELSKKYSQPRSI